MNEKALGFYDYVAVITPGAALLFGLFFVFPELKATFTAEGFSAGNLGLFVLVSYIAGQLIATGGNPVECAWWGFQGGIPTDWPRVGDRLMPEQGAAALQERVRRLPGQGSAVVRGADRAAWSHTVRAMTAAIRSAGRAARLDMFNAQYGMHRNLVAALAAVAVAALSLPPHRWGVTAWSLLLSAAALSRMHRFGIHYAREVMACFSGLPDAPAKVTDKPAEHG